MIRSPMAHPDNKSFLRNFRGWLVLFIIGLVLTGLTAFPLERETATSNHIFKFTPAPPSGEFKPIAITRSWRMEPTGSPSPAWAFFISR